MHAARRREAINSVINCHSSGTRAGDTHMLQRAGRETHASVRQARECPCVTRVGQEKTAGEEVSTRRHRLKLYGSAACQT